MVRAPNSRARERVGEADPSSRPPRPRFPLRRSRDLEDDDERKSDDRDLAKAKVQRQQAQEPRSSMQHQSRHIGNGMVLL